MLLHHWLTSILTRRSRSRHLSKILRQRRQRQAAEQNRRRAAVERLEEKLLLSGVSIIAPEYHGAESEELLNINDTASDRVENVSWELVFVDPAVDDYAALISGIAPDNYGEDAETIRFREIFVLDSRRDGVQQMTEVIGEFANVSAIHVLSHGSSGTLHLGGTTLDRSNLESYGTQLGSWRNSLATGADILLYGCDVANGEWGVGFVEDFAAATGADIAASDDLTGSIALGGNWTFETTTGVVSGTALLSTAALNDYAHTLSTAPVQHDSQQAITTLFGSTGLSAQVTATQELTVYATGDISLSNLHTDELLSLGFTSLIIEGSDSTDDTLIVDLSTGDVPLNVTYHGGAGGYDTLKVGGVSRGNYTPGQVFGDGVFTSGTTYIAFTGLEPVIIDGSLPSPSVSSGTATSGTTSLTNGTFTFTTPSTGNGNDLITIDSPAPGQNRVRYQRWSRLRKCHIFKHS